MGLSDTDAQSRWIAFRTISWACRALRAVASGCIVAALGAHLCCPKTFAQISDPTRTDRSEKSWSSTATRDILAARIPVQVTESHSQNGDQSWDQRSVRTPGIDRDLLPYQEMEIVTSQVDAGIARTTTRLFGRDGNGARSIIQLTEEEKHELPDGTSTLVSTTFNPDVNGRLLLVKQEIVEAKTIGDGIQETKMTVMLPNVDGALAPALKSDEVLTRRTDGTAESKKLIFVTDGTGNWPLNEVHTITTRQEGANRTREERVSRRDSEGKLSDVSDVVTKESDSNGGEKRITVDTYSIDVPGTPQDGKLHRIERATTFAKNDAVGQTIQQTVERLNPGDPGVGLRPSILVDGKTIRASSEDLSTVTIRARDVNGSYGIVYVDTTKWERSTATRVEEMPSKRK